LTRLAKRPPPRCSTSPVSRDSSGLHLLLDASHDSAVIEWGFFVVRPSEVVERLLQVSGTADWIVVADPRADRVLR